MAEITNSSQRIAKNTVFLYLRMLLTMAISLYTSRVVLNVLGVEDYGIYSVVGGFVSMFAMMNSAMTAATQRNLSYELGRKGDGELAIVFSNAIIIHLALGLFVLILLETFGLWFLNHKMVFAPDRYYAANWVFQFSVLTFIVNIISVPYNAALIAFERMKAFAYIGIIEVSSLSKRFVKVCPFLKDKPKPNLFAISFVTLLVFRYSTPSLSLE